MGVTGDIYQATLRGNINGQSADNVFLFRLTKSGALFGLATTLALLIESEWFAAVNPWNTNLFVNDMQWTGVKVVNLFDDGDFVDHVFSTPVEGTSSIDPMPPYVAYSMRSEWLGPGFRRIFKRFSGMPESNQALGILTPTAITLLQALADMLITPLQASGAGSVSTWDLVQVKRIKETDPDTGKVTYRLPEDQAETELSAPSTLTAAETTTTQNSRKYNSL